MELPFVSEFKTEQRVIWFIYLKDILIVMLFVTLGYAFKSYVHSKLETAFIIWNIFIGLLLTRKSKTNPKKRIYQAIMIMLNRDKHIYKPAFGNRNKF